MRNTLAESKFGWRAVLLPQVSRQLWITAAALFLAVVVQAQGQAQSSRITVEGLTQKLWPRKRIEQALKAVDQQKADGLLSQAAYEKRTRMLQARLSGVYKPESLSSTDPPLNFVQNGGFEQTNPNSAKNRSRWLWWNGWSWGGDYENRWEDRPEFVHSGKLSARIRCTGAKGRIGINTPPLPAVPGATAYRLTFWAKGEGDNLLFVNFEEGATGELRQKIDGQWRQYTVLGKPIAGKNSYMFYFYSIGAGTIWLDDAELVPVGGKLDE
jgi:hypothetical protein